MLESNSDLVGRIDELTSPDAMRSAPPADSGAKGVTALLLGMDDPTIIQLDRDDITGSLAHHVGDPMIDRIGYLGIVDFWVGDNSLFTSSFNEGASFVLDAALRAASSGDLAVPDRVHDHVRNLIADPSWQPVIHGPCVVTGVDGPDTVAIPDSFEHWFRRLATDMRIQHVMERVTRALADIGIEADAFVLERDLRRPDTR